MTQDDRGERYCDSRKSRNLPLNWKLIFSRLAFQRQNVFLRRYRTLRFCVGGNWRTEVDDKNHLSEFYRTFDTDVARTPSIE